MTLSVAASDDRSHGNLMVFPGVPDGRAEPQSGGPHSPSAEPTRDAEAVKSRKQRKESRKVRSAWIAFVGRIVAQIVGAVATVALGFLVADGLRHPKETAATVSSVAPSSSSIAVLPLANLARTKSAEPLADSLTEGVITELTRLRASNVVSRTSTMHYKEEAQTLPAIARELGAAFVLEGSVLESGGKVRVTAQLIDALSDRHVWAASYDRRSGDLLTLQDDVAAAIARDVDAAISRATRISAATRR
jgi:TolB-like protein